MSIFGTDGVRGRAGEGLLGAGEVERLGAAFATALGADAVIAVARDTRISGPWIRDSLLDGLTAVGADVVDLGVLPTPALSRALAAEAAWSGGVMITASHNPFHDNGLKFFGPDGLKATDDLQSAVEELFEGPIRVSGPRGSVDWSHVDRVRADYLASLVQDDAWPGPLVFDDAAGAAAGLFAELLGPDAVAVAAAPDGRNINEGVGAVHPEAAAVKVVAVGAWGGIVVDGDGDRIMVVDELGGVHDGDAILGFLAGQMADAGTLRGGAIVGTVTSNSGLEAWLGERGLSLIRTPVGDRHVAAAMVERGCNLGGESSGHVLTPDLCPTGDGIRVGLTVLRSAAAAGRPLSELLGAIPRFPSAKRKVPDGARPPIDRLLGGPEVRPVLSAIEDGGGRSLVRYSGTEPYLRIQVEGPDADLVEAWADRLASVAGASLGG